ncbi:hypothetical protein ABT263_05130 [Kitasatospora sp. NPDC001603]|uniref:hypothetical protein n=1 Tax=Kitasatospora sp. NPDC001603 TaxID=3154388 RepID=UPI0033344850
MRSSAAPDRPPFDAVLCDIDGVLRFFDQHEVTRLERAAGLGMTGLLHREPEDLRRALAPLFDGPRAPGR